MITNPGRVKVGCRLPLTGSRGPLHHAMQAELFFSLASLSLSLLHSLFPLST